MQKHVYFPTCTKPCPPAKIISGSFPALTIIVLHMKISIFGSTGQTGQELIKQGLKKGYSISTIVRNEPDITNPNLTVIKGNIFDKKLVKDTIDKSDLVISVMAFTPKLFGQKSTELYSKTASVLAEAMTELNLKKLAFCTSAGVEEDPNEIWFYKHILKPFYLSKGYKDMQLAEKIISNSTLDWILVRPSRLTNAALTTQFRISQRFRPKEGSSISRADLAFFILNQLNSSDWVHKTPTLAY